MKSNDRKWQITRTSKIPKLNNPVFIEGLPGIGNVGKVAVDFLIDDTKAVKLYEITSYTFPHSVFVNEDNIVELPIIEIFYKKFNGKRQDIIFLGGDVQPIDEFSCYEFSDMVLDMIQELGTSEVITLGGVGLAEIPKNPKVYCTGNSKKIIEKYKTTSTVDKLYNVVGPIMGVSGLMLGLAGKRNIPAVSFLAETYGHPMYLGVKGAREILKVLNEKLRINVDIGKMDREIREIETEVAKKSEQLGKISKSMALKKMSKIGGDVDYIG